MEGQILLLFILVLAIFLGIELITKVPSTLHTPLMSGANAISGITLVGALLSSGSGEIITTILGTAAVFFATIIAAVLLSDSNYRVEVLSRASLLSAMISLVFGLIVLYQSYSGGGLNEGMYEGLSIAMNGLNYGLFSYICIYMVSYKFGTTEKINAPLINWHWMEVTGFLIFMFFAPETLRESLLH